MALFQDAVKDDQVTALDSMDDRELYRRWLTVGVRLYDERRDEFATAFAACLRAFEFSESEVPDPCLDNWEVIGSKLITAGDDRRRTACAVIVQAREALTEDRTEHHALTFLRLAKVIDRIVLDASEYVASDPDVDKFFVELEQDDANELEELQRLQPELVIAGLAMSLNEWALAYPSVQLVEIVANERCIDVRVQREAN